MNNGHKNKLFGEEFGKLFRLREKAHKKGLVILENGEGFIITNHCEKTKIEIFCKTLKEVKKKLSQRIICCC